MYRIANLAAYDVLSEVHINVRVLLYDGEPGVPAELEFSCATTVDGVGSSEGREWLRDALVALIEAM